jgi:LuxR family transcriptional regulator, maltose regulon positive regulatory protein
MVPSERVAYHPAVADPTPLDDALAAGRDALARGAWQEARSLFEDALTHDELPEALEGLSWAAWWQEDAAACIDARERGYRR